MPCQQQQWQSEKKQEWDGREAWAEQGWRILQDDGGQAMEIAQETYNLFQFISFSRHLVC